MSVIYVILMFSVSFFIQILNAYFISVINIIFPLTLIFDFCLRFLFKANPTAGILPYLCFPIKKQILISYILISELISVWIVGCLFIYFLIFYKCGFFIHSTAFIAFTTFFIWMLFNNYFVFLIKTLLKEYSILLFAVCLAIFSCILFLFLNLESIIHLILSCFLLFSILLTLNIALKRDLYKELNNFAC
jgi:hypothetical protein